MNKAIYLLLAISVLAITPALATQEYDGDGECYRDRQCFDGDYCTTDTCENNVCVHRNDKCDKEVPEFGALGAGLIAASGAGYVVLRQKLRK